MKDWKQAERRVASILGGVRVPVSGRRRGDALRLISVVTLTAEDLEAFEMRCRIKPKKNPQTGQVLGSTVDWETMRRLPETGKPVASPVPAGDPSVGYVEGEAVPDPEEH